MPTPFTWLAACAGGLPSVAVVDTQEVSVNDAAGDASLIQRPIICPPGGLRYAFATLQWNMHDATSPSGCPEVQVSPVAPVLSPVAAHCPCMLQQKQPYAA